MLQLFSIETARHKAQGRRCDPRSATYRIIRTYHSKCACATISCVSPGAALRCSRLRVSECRGRSSAGVHSARAPRHMPCTARRQNYGRRTKRGLFGSRDNDDGELGGRNGQLGALEPFSSAALTRLVLTNEAVTARHPTAARWGRQGRGAGQ